MVLANFEAPFYMLLVRIILVARDSVLGFEKCFRLDKWERACYS